MNFRTNSLSNNQSHHNRRCISFRKRCKQAAYPAVRCELYFFLLRRFRESLIIQSRAEVRKIYGRMLSKLRRNTDVFQGVLTKLCREDFVLMRGKEFLEVPLRQQSVENIAEQGAGGSYSELNATDTQ